MAEQKNEISVMPNQNIYDISIQEYGSVEGIFNLVTENDLGLSTIVEVGSTLNANSEVINKKIANYYKTHSAPATGNKILLDAEPVLEGIEYWAIEVDFEVQ